MATFFCSDPHAFHANIIKHCRRFAFLSPADRDQLQAIEAEGGDLSAFHVGEESVAIMNQRLAENINTRVKPSDVLWCLGDWVFGGRHLISRARWFRDQIHCRTVHLVWGNHDDRRIRDLFSSTHDQVEIQVQGVKLTLNHYPMVTWNSQHHATVDAPNIHLYGHVHGIYDRDPSRCPVKDAAAWPALDVGFDGHDYQVWSMDEILDRMRPRLEAFERLKVERGQFDPFRGRRNHHPARLRTAEPEAM